MIQQKFVHANGLHIAYREKNPSHLHTLVFVHGNSSSSRFWEGQLNDPQFDRYRLIALDLPAHGASDVSSTPYADYSVTGLGRVIAEVVSALALKNDFVVAGISLGTNVVVEALSFGMMPTGLVLLSPSVLGGHCTIDKVFRGDADVSFLFAHDVDPVNVKRCYDAGFPTVSAHDRIWIEEDYFSVRAPFRSVLAETVARGEIQDEISILQKYGKPSLIVFGRDEILIHTHYLNNVSIPCWRDQIFTLTGGHFVTLDNTKEINTLIAAYCDDLFTAGHSPRHNA